MMMTPQKKDEKVDRWHPKCSQLTATAKADLVKPSANDPHQLPTNDRFLLQQEIDDGIERCSAVREPIACPLSRPGDGHAQRAGRDQPEPMMTTFVRVMVPVRPR